MSWQRKLSRRRFAASVLAVGGTVLGVACGATAPTPASSGAASPTAAPGAPTSAKTSPTTASSAAPTKAPAAAAPPSTKSGGVTFSFWGHNHVPRVNLDKRLFEEFQKQQEITVDYVVVPQEYEVKLTASMASGEGPDLYNLTTSYNYTFMHKGLATTVDYTPWGVGNQAGFEKLYLSGALDGFTYQGKLYGVPSEVSNYAPFINKAMFQEAGLDSEKDYPKSWEDMPAAADKLTKRDGDNLARRGFDFTYMTQQGRWTSPLHTFLGMANQLGGEPFSSDLQQSTIDGEPFVEALQYQHDWIYKHKLGSPALLGSNQAFATGENAMSLIGYWAFSSLEKEYPEVYPNAGAFPFPQFRNAVRKSGAALYGYAWMVNSKAMDPQKEAAWKTVKFISDHPEDYLKEAGLLQPKLTLTESSWFQSLPHIGVFLKDAEGTPFSIRHVNGIEITNAIIRGMERVTQEGMDPKQSLQQAKQEVDDIIKKG